MWESKVDMACPLLTKAMFMVDVFNAYEFSSQNLCKLFTGHTPFIKS
jgi:hypothetical protein